VSILLLPPADYLPVVLAIMGLLRDFSGKKLDSLPPADFAEEKAIAINNGADRSLRK
jgi:hypothetical protein